MNVMTDHKQYGAFCWNVNSCIYIAVNPSTFGISLQYSLNWRFIDW